MLNPPYCDEAHEQVLDRMLEGIEKGKGQLSKAKFKVSGLYPRRV